MWKEFFVWEKLNQSAERGPRGQLVLRGRVDERQLMKLRLLRASNRSQDLIGTCHGRDGSSLLKQMHHLRGTTAQRFVSHIENKWATGNFENNRP